MSITEDKATLAQARKRLNKTIKSELADALLATFTNKNIYNVVFGVSTSPYEDGLLREGVFGPIENFELSGDKYGFGSADESKLLDYRAPQGGAPKVAALFEEAEWDNVAEALGITDNEASAFVATRTEAGNFKLSEYTIERY